MKVEVRKGELVPVSDLSFDDWRRLMGEFIYSSNGGKAWDLITALRGPDSPSERPDLSSVENSKRYKARRDRKFETVEVIRQKAFFGRVSGAARHRESDFVTLPPRGEWDHFDKHVERAASVVGLEVRTKGVE